MRVRTYDPFHQFDRLFTAATPARPEVPLDVVRHEDNVELFFDLPGVDVESIELTVDKRELILRADRNFEPAEGGEMVRSERRHGSFARKLLLAENLNTEDLEADYSDGVLKVTIAVIAEAKPLKIHIGSGSAEITA